MRAHELLKKTEVPESDLGPFVIGRFEVSEDAAFRHMMSSVINGTGHRRVPAGTYTWLKRNGVTVMSDTPAELYDHHEPVNEGTGHCLIVGLGLGIVTEALLRKPDVTKVTVVEISPEVVELVAPYLEEKYGDRVEFVEADIFEWKPPKDAHYGMAWFDIWDDMSEDNLPEMAKLSRRFTKYCDWYGHWGREEIRAMKRRDRAAGWY